VGIIPDELHRLLVRWAIWARGSHLDRHMKLICRSIEHKHLGRATNVYTSVEDIIKADLRRHDVIRDSDMLEVERAVMRLPDKHRLAVRLHYVVHKRVPLIQKRKLLGCREDEYDLLVLRGAVMVARRLGLNP
jgi:DNA-directed RNA polymerase specialized sigma24 family protein